MTSTDILELFLFFAFVFHASSIGAVQATVSVDNLEAPRHHVRISSEAYSLLTTTLRAATMASASFSNGETTTLVNHFEASMGAAVPLGRVARKQQRGTEGSVVRHANGENLSDDNQLNDDDYRIDKCATGDDHDEIARALAKRISRARNSDGTEEYDNEDDAVVAADTKMRRVRRRKARAERHYRDGPKIWGEWGKWASCSASCGAGKLTRWRHCVGGGCSLGEKEAQLKTCTYSAC